MGREQSLEPETGVELFELPAGGWLLQATTEGEQWGDEASHLFHMAEGASQWTGVPSPWLGWVAILSMGEGHFLVLDERRLWELEIVVP